MSVGVSIVTAWKGAGGNGQIRTAGLPLRRRPLYPSELRPQLESILPALQAFSTNIFAELHSVDVAFVGGGVTLVATGGEGGGVGGVV